MILLSIFDPNDGNLGAVPNSRVVVLKGVSTVNGLFNSSAFPIGDWLRTALAGRGFDIISLRWDWQSLIPFFGGNTIDIEIELNVSNDFTSEQARQDAIRQIELFTANFGTAKVFSNTALNVTFDAFGQINQSQPGNNQSPNPANPPNSIGGSPAVNPVAPNSDFLGKLGTALGISTPVVLLAGGIILLIVLRK